MIGILLPPFLFYYFIHSAPLTTLIYPEILAVGLTYYLLVSISSASSNVIFHQVWKIVCYWRDKVREGFSTLLYSKGIRIANSSLSVVEQDFEDVQTLQEGFIICFNLSSKRSEANYKEMQESSSDGC